jgi:hypothetical protein
MIIAAAYDQYGYSKLNSLLKNIVFVFFCLYIAYLYSGFIFFEKSAGAGKGYG